MPVCRRAADITACVDAGREAQGREAYAASMAHFSGRPRRLMIHLGAETRRALAITARATCYGPATRSKGRLEGLAVAGLGCHGAGRKKAREWRGAWEDDRRLARAVRASASASASLHRGRGRWTRVGVTGGGIVTGRGRWRLPTGGRWPSWAPHRPEDEGGRDRHPSFPACPPRRCAKLCAHDTLVDLVPSGMHFDSFPSRWIVRVVL